MAFSRREFLAQLSTLCASWAAMRALPGCQARPLPGTTGCFNGDQLATLRALCSHILPSDQDPGATEAGCAEFISSELAKEPFAVLRAILEDGLRSLDATAKGIHATGFAGLDSAGRDTCLSQVARLKNRALNGERFAHLAVVLTLEGFLCAPRHGGNRDGVGWRFAQFEPVRFGPNDARAWRDKR
jgi:gluconate 2-dehydrogenase gamma chain